MLIESAFGQAIGFSPGSIQLLTQTKQPVSAVFRVFNPQGTQNIRITLKHNKAWAEPMLMSLEPGSTKTISFSIEPDKVGEFRDEIQITTDSKQIKAGASINLRLRVEGKSRNPAVGLVVSSSVVALGILSYKKLEDNKNRA